MRNPFRRDLVLIHPPAIYDFRTRQAFLGPVADAVPSTPIFEMYPVGLTSIAAFLERHHYNVQILNLAYRMLREKTLDVPACLARVDAPMVGIDLRSRCVSCCRRFARGLRSMRYRTSPGSARTGASSPTR